MRLICEFKDHATGGHAPMSYLQSDLKTVRGYVNRLKRLVEQGITITEAVIYWEIAPYQVGRYMAYLGTMTKYWDYRVKEFRSTSALVNHDLAIPINL